MPIQESRWNTGSTSDAPFFRDENMALPLAILAPMTAEQLDAYVTHIRIKEIGLQLRQPENVLMARAYHNNRDRSPEPEYDAAGRRTNTRSQRRRRALEAERHRCIEEILTKIPSYRLPINYRRPTTFVDRVFIPQTDFPSVNFIGQTLGPRGSTLKALQKQAGAAIAIRGKGSVKEGRFRQKIRHGTSDDDSGPLHVLITSDAQAKVEEAKKLVQQIIENTASTPEGQNEHKRNQLRDLAVMNGTFRDDEARLDLREERQLVNVVRAGQDAHVESPMMNKFDEEYRGLLNDIGETRKAHVVPSHEPVSPAKLPPWRVDRAIQLGRY